jgi:hypothetical protein
MKAKAIANCEVKEELRVSWRKDMGILAFLRNL